MDGLLALFNEIFGSSGVASAVFVALAGLTVAALAMGIATTVLGVTNPLRRRLSVIPGAETTRERKNLDLSKLVGPVAQYVLPQKGEEVSEIRLRLIHAGYRSPQALQNFYGLKTALALGLPIFVLVGSQWVADLTTASLLFALAFAAFIGVAVPNFVLEHLKNRRLKRLRNGFPDALDLLVVCVESGLGLAAAIQRVARELEVSHPELAGELDLVNVEMRAGVERAAALKNLAERSGLEDIRGLVGLLVQTIKFGTSVADALRVYSEEFRDKRMQKAEEMAAKIGTKLIFPLVLCMFPAFFIVAVAPAAMRIIWAFQQL